VGIWTGILVPLGPHSLLGRGYEVFLPKTKGPERGDIEKFGVGFKGELQVACQGARGRLLAGDGKVTGPSPDSLKAKKEMVVEGRRTVLRLIRGTNSLAAVRKP